MTAGRPSKYDPAFCEQVIEAAGEGYSLEAFAGKIQVARSTLNKWMDDHPEFKEAVAISKPIRTYGLETVLIAIQRAGGDKTQLTAVIWGLKNVSPHEWRDRQVVDIGNDEGKPLKVEMNDRELARRIALTLAQAS